MEFVTISAKTVMEAVTEACKKFDVTSDKLEYTVVEEGKSGILGIGAKPAVISVRVMEEKLEDKVKLFLDDIFAAMNLEVIIKVTYDEAEKTMEIDLVGDEMGVLIGKRGQTLDSLQYLVSLVANKGQADFIRVKVDTENYRERRKDTLENLAKNIASKVKRTRRSFALEPMNPYERRIIHATLQGNKYVTTHSDGDEPFRHVVVSFKR